MLTIRVGLTEVGAGTARQDEPVGSLNVGEVRRNGADAFSDKPCQRPDLHHRLQQGAHQPTVPTTRHGVPKALLLLGMSSKTRLLAPIIQPSPIVTPFVMIAFGPI